MQKLAAANTMDHEDAQVAADALVVGMGASHAGMVGQVVAKGHLLAVAEDPGVVHADECQDAAAPAEHDD